MHPPAPSPPWAASAVGRREEGRGVLLQSKLAEFLREKCEVLHGGDKFAMRTALSEIALLALESTISTGSRTSWLSSVHPVAFRKACVAGTARSANGPGSAVEAIAALVSADDSESDAETTVLALQALEAIAIDEPTTDVDNDHALAICATGVVQHIVRLLSSSDAALHTRAAAAAAALVENAYAARMFLGAGVVSPLLVLVRHGGDEARQAAMGALRMLSIDRDARQAMAAKAMDLLGRVHEVDPFAREAAAELRATLEEPLGAAVDSKGHARLARDSRVSQSKLWAKAQRSPQPERQRAGARFRQGSRVLCNMGNGISKAGAVVALDVIEDGQSYKYKVALDDGSGALVPQDTDQFVRPEKSTHVPPRAHNQAASAGLDASRLLSHGG